MVANNYHFDLENLVINGWKFDGVQDVGKRKRLYAPSWTKDNNTVYFLNESQYSHVGYYEIAIIANSPEHIEAFLKDFPLFIKRFQVEENDSAQQWG